MTPKLVHPTMPTPSYVACAIYKVQTLLFPLYNHNILITFIIGTSMSYIRCALPFVQGAIDDTHISIVKHLGPFAKNYYFHKTSGYNMVAQAVVDYKKRFINLPSSVNDSRVFKNSTNMLNIMVFFIMTKLMYVNSPHTSLGTSDVH